MSAGNFSIYIFFHCCSLCLHMSKLSLSQIKIALHSQSFLVPFVMTGHSILKYNHHNRDYFFNTVNQGLIYHLVVTRAFLEIKLIRFLKVATNLQWKVTQTLEENNSLSLKNTSYTAWLTPPFNRNYHRYLKRAQ